HAGDAHVAHSAHHGHGGSDKGSSYGVGHEGHGSASGGTTASVPTFHFPFFSPPALATLFATIGAYGLISQFGFHLGEGPSLAAAIPAAFVASYLVTYAAWRLVHGSTGSSQIRTSDLLGASGEVTTPIPAGGVGEVAAMVDGQRFSCAAREAGGGAVPR